MRFFILVMASFFAVSILGKAAMLLSRRPTPGGIIIWLDLAIELGLFTWATWLLAKSSEA